MYFERRLNCDSAEWQSVDIQTILSIVDNADLDLMIWFKQTVIIGSYQYRRYIPSVITDWAVVSGEKQKFMPVELV